MHFALFNLFKTDRLDYNHTKIFLYRRIVNVKLLILYCNKCLLVSVTFNYKLNNLSVNLTSFEEVLVELPIKLN